MVKSPEPAKTKVLLIEDDPLSAEILEEALVRGGYDVAHALNADEGWQWIEDWEPRLVITDHDMPGRSGLELLCDLRQRQNYVTLIFVSGRKDTRVVVKALEEGADDFIEKPFRIPELLARVAVALRNNETHRLLAEKNRQLEAMVETDELTGLYNMRSIYERIDKEIARTHRGSRSLAVVMMDMDHFKSVNDGNDHLFGSFVLAEVGKIIRGSIREYDFAARYGGDEFMICLTDIDATGALSFCQRLREKIAAYDFRDGDNHIRLTCSMGVALHRADAQKIDARQLLRAADHALYESKNTGRNRVSVHVDTGEQRETA